MKQIITLLLCLLPATLVKAQQTETIGKDLEAVKLSPRTYIHVSYTENEKYGRFSSNGLIYVNNNEAVIMDTPADTLQSRQLLEWFSSKFPEAVIKAVIVNHFHSDCLGGLQVFHQQGIKSYSYYETQRLAVKDSATPPQHIFTDELRLDIGGQEVISRFFGEAHSRDNIVTWIPSERILFGGCMVKSLNASKGNIADANLKTWSATVRKVKYAYSQARIVVPGHGDYGDPRLLDYTIQLFRSR